MYKLFMVMCVLVNGESQCTLYDDSTNRIYQELAKCEADAEMRFGSIRLRMYCGNISGGRVDTIGWSAPKYHSNPTPRCSSVGYTA